MKIRRMTAADVKRVIRLDVLAFRTYYRRKRPRPGRAILAALALNPSGCFVAEERTLSGYLFSRKWGRLGWIGTFGVHPEHGSKGIGKELLRTAYGELDKECAIIGLETMPEAPYNIGLYLKDGYKLIHPTLVLDKTGLAAAGAPSVLEEISPEEVSRLSRGLLGGIDYGAEAANALEFGWGRSFSIGEKGFCILSANDASEKPFLNVNALGVKALRKEDLLRLEEHALSGKRDRLVISLNSLHRSALDLLLRSGYKVRRCNVRMLKKGSYGGFKAADLSRWAM